MLQNLKRHLVNFLVATKLLFTEKWSSWKASRATKRVVYHLDAEAFAAIINSKDEFITYLQDEIAELKAQMRDDKPERVRVESDFVSNRGYKSIHTRVRERVMAMREKHAAVPTKEESQYEKVVVE